MHALIAILLFGAALFAYFIGRTYAAWIGLLGAVFEITTWVLLSVWDNSDHRFKDLRPSAAHGSSGPSRKESGNAF